MVGLQSYCFLTPILTRADDRSTQLLPRFQALSLVGANSPWSFFPDLSSWLLTLTWTRCYAAAHATAISVLILGTYLHHRCIIIRAFLWLSSPPASGYYSIVMAERNLLYFWYYDSKIEYQAFDLNNKYNSIQYNPDITIPDTTIFSVIEMPRAEYQTRLALESP